MLTFSRDATDGFAAAGSRLPLCLMHMQGEPGTMQSDPRYRDVVTDVGDFLQSRMDAALAARVGRRRLLLDPGFGFGKSLQHNLTLLKHLDRLRDLGCPLLVGMSRKSMIGAILNKPVAERLHGSVAAALLAATAGASIIRVHDVGPTVDALKMWQAVQAAS